MSLLTRLQSWALTALAVLAALAGAYVWGGAKARRAAELREQTTTLTGQVRAAEETTTAAKERADVQAEVDRMPDSAVRQRLRDKWTRPD